MPIKVVKVPLQNVIKSSPSLSICFIFVYFSFAMEAAWQEILPQSRQKGDGTCDSHLIIL